MKAKIQLKNTGTMFWGGDPINREIVIKNDEIKTLELTPYIQKRIDNGVFIQIVKKESKEE